MPILDGYETAKALKQRFEENALEAFPIIGFTAMLGENEIQKCLESGMDDVLEKPCSKDKLLRVLERWLA